MKRFVILAALALAGCSSTVSDLKSKPPEVLHSQTDYETAYRHMSRLARDCDAGAFLLTEFGVDADLYPSSQTAEITIWMNNPARVTMAYAEISKEGSGSLVRLWQVNKAGRDLKRALAGKTTCSD